MPDIDLTISIPGGADLIGTLPTGSNTDAVGIITTQNAVDGSIVTVQAGLPINQSYTGSVSSNQATVTIPAADLPVTTQTFTIDQNNQTLTSSNPTISWTENGTPPAAGWRYDLHADTGSGFVDQGTSTTLTTWPNALSFPQDGRSILLRVYRWEDGTTPPLDANNRPDVPASDIANATVTANTIASSGNGYNAFNGDIPFERSQLYTKPSPGQLINASGIMGFSSWSSLINQLNSTENHNGQVYVYTGTELLSSYNPFVRNAKNYKVQFAGGAFVDGGSNTLINDGAFYGLRLTNNEDAEWHDPSFKNYRNGAISLGDEQSTAGTTTNTDLKIIGAQASRAGQWAFKTVEDSTRIRWEACHAENIGRQTDSSGEAFYVGDGGEGSIRRAFDVTIIGCSAKTIYGEAVDLKRDSRGLYVGFCDFEEVILQHSGAITLALNDIASRGAYDIQATIEYNYIRDVRSRDTGNKIHAIEVAMGGANIRRNIITDIDGAGVSGTNDFNGPNSTVNVDENIILRTGLATIVPERGNNIGADNPGTFICTGNITDDGAEGQALITNENLVGPLTELAGFSPA